MRKVRVDNGLVVEVLDLEPFPPFHEALIWVESPTANIGDMYENGGFSPAPTPRVVPQQVTRFQGRAALYQAGLLDDIEAYMALPTTDWLIKMAWEQALHFDRPSPMIASLKDLFGLTDSQIDDLFIFAKTIS